MGTYSNTDIFMVCFSVVHPSSFENIKWWLLEVKKHCPNTPIVLCGTKIDLRDDPATIDKLEAGGEKPIPYKTGQKKAKEIKARAYMECSAKDFPSVSEVFRACTRVIMDKDKKMWADVHKRAKKEDKAEARKMAKIEARKKKIDRETKKKESVDDLLPDEEA